MAHRPRGARTRRGRRCLHEEPPLDFHAADISKLEIDPFPEGPPGPTFTREPVQDDATFLFDLKLVEPFIPDPLPNAPRPVAVGRVAFFDTYRPVAPLLTAMAGKAGCVSY